jgi:hypothetical protein
LGQSLVEMITDALSGGMDAGRMGVRSQSDDATARRTSVTLHQQGFAKPVKITPDVTMPPDAPVAATRAALWPWPRITPTQFKNLLEFNKHRPYH